MDGGGLLHASGPVLRILLCCFFLARGWKSPIKSSKFEDMTGGHDSAGDFFSGFRNNRCQFVTHCRAVDVSEALRGIEVSSFSPLGLLLAV